MNRASRSAFLVGMVLVLPPPVRAEDKVIRLGMIGLDTSHVIAFTNYLNNPRSYGHDVGKRR
jgi:hypothetical protein